MKLNLARKLLYFVAVTLLALNPRQTIAADYQTTVLSKSPLGYWRLTETTAVPGTPDIIANAGSLGAAGNGYPGPDVIKAQAGVVGTSCSFTNPGASFNYDPFSIIDVPYNPALNPNGPFTVEFWANPNDHATDAVAPIASLNVNESRSGYVVYHDAINRLWEFRIGGTASYAATIDSPTNSVQPNTWYHVVGVFDGANALLYVDGQLVAGPKAANGGAGYNPNNSQPFRIGATTFPNRGFDGQIDEVAFYGTALSASVIASHHDAGLNNQAGYAALVQSANPVLFLHLDEPVYTPPDPSTLPVTANSGTAGTEANGTSYPGVTAGAAGPPFSGFGADNRGLQLTGVGGNVAIGNPNGLNFDGQTTLIAWIKPQLADGLRNIISHGYRLAPNQEVQMRINGGNYEVGSWEPAEGATNTAGLAVGDIGNWVFLAGTFDGANWNLYRYDALIASGPGTAGALSMDAPWSLGSRGDSTIDPGFFGGGIDEVAIFNSALSADDLKQIYYSANPLLITKQPQAPAGAVFETTPVTLTVVAEGTPPLAYQWTKNTLPISGQTGSSLVLNNVTVGDNGSYAVIVSSSAGSSVTSSIVALTVTAPLPQFTQQPNPASRYVGASATFSVTAIGAQLSYQWKYNDTTVIPGANSASYTISPVSFASAGNYKCTVTNPSGTADSDNAALTVLPAPTGYGATIIGDDPVAYWRLGETSGTVARDYWGGHDGQYNDVTLGLPGFAVVDSDKAAGFTAVDTFVGGISGIDFTGDNSIFSLEAWVNGSVSQLEGAAIISKGRGGNGGGGVNGWQYVLEVTNRLYRLHVETISGNAADATATVGPDGTWQHVVGVYDGPGGAMHIYVNGVESGTASSPSGGPLGTGLAVTIGAGQGGVTPVHDLFFNGSIDEAAIYNQALSADQVLAHYNAVYGPNTAPIIFLPPVSATNYETRAVNLKVVAGGSPPLSYQWRKGTANVPAATSDRLTLSPLAVSDAGDYNVVVSNMVGTNTSSTATVTVLPFPTSAIVTPGLILHLPFDNSFSDTSGRDNSGSAVGSPSFVDGKVGTKALHYGTLTSDGMSGSPVVASNYVTLGVRPDLQFGPNVNFSVAYWVRLPENTMPGDLPFIANNDYSFGGPGYTFAPSYEEGGWSWYINNKTSGNFSGIGLYSPEMNNINDGAWHHLAHTFDRTGNAVTYLDGIQVDATPIAAGVAWDLGTGKPTDIGQAGGAYPEPMESDIDDIGMWSRVLTPIEVDGIYLGGNVNGVSFTSAPTSVSIRIQNLGAQIQLMWSPTGGTLEQADSLTGPWNSLGTANPQKVTNSGTGAQYFRVHVQ